MSGEAGSLARDPSAVPTPRQAASAGPLDAVRSALAPLHWSRWAVAGAVLALAITLLDLALGRAALLTALLVLAPLAVSLPGRLGDTVAVALLALALAVLGALAGGDPANAEIAALVVVAMGGGMAVLVALGRASAEVSLARFRLLSAVADVGNEADTLDDAVARLLDILSPAFADVCVLDARLGGSERRLGVRPSDADPAAVEAALRDGDRRPEAAISLPLRARGATIGTLAMLLGPSGRRYSGSDVTFAEVFSGRAAVVLDNAGLTRELDVAARELEAALDGLAEAVTVMGVDGRAVYANDAAVELLRLESARELLDAEPGVIMERFDVSDEQGRPVSLRDLPSYRVLDGERQPEPLLVRNVVKATGEERWLLTKTSAISDASGQVVRIVNVIEDVTEAKRAELSQRLLAEASDALASSLDYELTLQHVAEAAVPALADWCGLDLPGREGVIAPVAVAHGDPDAVALARRLHAAGTASLMVVPLAAGGRTLGALTLARSDPHRPFDATDLELAEEIARRAGHAVLNARLYTERTAIAATLQRGLQPPELRAMPGFEAASLYRVAGELNEVGGDFYDAFPTDDGWMVVIGDVAGQGAEAATLTGLARYTLRSVGQLTADPARAMQQLNATLRDQPRLSLCTAVCAQLLGSAGETATIVLANCGHPHPLLLRDGDLHELGDAGPMAGAFDDAAWPSARVELRVGDTVVLYTDGVTDTVGADGRFGEQRLRAALRGAPAAEPSALVERLGAELEAFQQGGQRDDVAVVVLRFVG